MFAMGVLLVVVVIGMVALRVRGRRDAMPAPVRSDDPEPNPEPPVPGSLALAAERGLAEVGDLCREPREAIIACYVAMELALANAPGAATQDSDTPSEVLARAVEHEAIHAGSATELVTLFAEARLRGLCLVVGAEVLALVVAEGQWVLPIAGLAVVVSHRIDNQVG
ncbi:DUF4129 domain-containing protein [Mycolicibacterium sarraceniae]